MKFGCSLTGRFKKQVHLILSGYIQIWHFYRTCSRGHFFPGHTTQCSFICYWYWVTSALVWNGMFDVILISVDHILREILFIFWLWVKCDDVTASCIRSRNQLIFRNRWDSLTSSDFCWDCKLWSCLHRCHSKTNRCRHSLCSVEYSFVCIAHSLSVLAVVRFDLVTLRASCGAVYCNRSCLWVCGCVCVGGWVCAWDCYHDNSKLRASIFTKLGL